MVYRFQPLCCTVGATNTTLLSGRDFDPTVPLNVAEQVDKLIIQGETGPQILFFTFSLSLAATDISNLAPSFAGWYVKKACYMSNAAEPASQVRVLVVRWFCSFHPSMCLFPLQVP